MPSVPQSRDAFGQGTPERPWASPMIRPIPSMGEEEEEVELDIPPPQSLWITFPRPTAPYTSICRSGVPCQSHDPTRGDCVPFLFLLHSILEEEEEFPLFY